MRRLVCSCILNAFHIKDFVSISVRGISFYSTSTKTSLNASLARNVGFRQHTTRTEFARKSLFDNGLDAIRTTEDRHHGVHVDLGFMNEAESDVLCKENFKKCLKEFVGNWRSLGKTAIWLTVPIEYSDLIPLAAKEGFTFHHAESDRSTLALWLQDDIESRIPAPATHQVGVGGCCIHPENNRILVIKEKNKKNNLWKFPGGLSYLSEDFGATAQREVFEETGIKTMFHSIIGFRQLHNYPGAFGKSDLYLVAKLTPVTFDIDPCPVEIAECRWMDVEEFMDSTQVTPISYMLAEVAQHCVTSDCNGIEFVPVKSNSDGQDYYFYRCNVPS